MIEVGSLLVCPLFHGIPTSPFIPDFSTCSTRFDDLYVVEYEHAYTARLIARP